MKTPREILFEKHRDAEAKLSQLDAQPLAEYARESSRQKTSTRALAHSWLKYFWSEAVLPWRKIWIGIASAWLVIIGMSLTVNSRPGGAVAEQAKVDPQTRTVLLEQQRMLAQLLEPTAPPVRLKPATPGPRSDARLQEVYV
ncbi:MAG TPA: hypothetical protein VH413_04475 [Verrucomicrobiae bacterium]|jgi:hypothetical protein|nr:hypothetical protein [Verrucomicrobiae bacterium]